MELERILQERYSVRKYDPRPIEAEVMNQILEAGRLAPTGKNLQPQRIFVLQSPEALAKVRSVCKCTFGAPAVLLVCWDEEAVWHNPLDGGSSIGEMDASIVTSAMMLRAWELGVGSCWVKYFNPADMIRAFELPQNLRPACLLDLGYPAADAEPRADMHFSRRPINETCVVL